MWTMYVDGREGAEAANWCEDGEFPINKKLRKVGKLIRRVKREGGKGRVLPVRVYCISILSPQCFPNSTLV